MGTKFVRAPLDLLARSATDIDGELGRPRLLTALARKEGDRDTVCVGDELVDAALKGTRARAATRYGDVGGKEGDG